jgi:hypothetical protein
MANALFDPGREGFLLGEIDWDTAVIKVALVRGYTFNAAHKFVSDVTTAGGTLVATSAALASKTGTSGVADAADVTFTAVGAGPAITSYIAFQSSAVTGGADVAATAQRLIGFWDNRSQVEIAVTAAISATALVPEDLPADLANGATMTLISGTGQASVVTSAASAAGTRAITCVALASGITAGAVYEYARSGSVLPLTPNGSDITITWDNGANRMFKL